MFEWITGFIEQSGYLGIAILMFVENVFPPIPSELIMPLGGFSASEGELNIFLVILSGSIGSVAGAALWYYIGKWIGLERLKGWTSKHGRLLTLSSEEVDQANDWFERHGGKAVFLGRLIPTVRTLISVPAGFAKMPLGRFLVYSTAGTVLWIGTLAGAGYLLGGQYEQISRFLNPASNVVVGMIVLYYLYRVAAFRSDKKD